MKRKNHDKDFTEDIGQKIKVQQEARMAVDNAISQVLVASWQATQDKLLNTLPVCNK